MARGHGGQGQAPRPRMIVLERRTRVASLYLQGEQQYAIARMVGVSQQQISADLKAVRDAWLASTVRDFDAAKAQELAKIDLLEVEAWQAWMRSKQPREITITEGIEGGLGPGHRTSRKAIVRREEQVGDPRFLERIQKCIEQRSALLGLNAPQKFAPTTPDGEHPAEMAVIYLPSKAPSAEAWAADLHHLLPAPPTNGHQE